MLLAWIIYRVAFFYQQLRKVRTVLLKRTDRSRGWAQILLLQQGRMGSAFK